MKFACPGLLRSLRSGATAVTPSFLLAQVASHNFTCERLKEGLETWQRPEIHSANAWLKICWQRARYSGADVPALLSSAQEQALWRRVIADRTPGLFNIDGTAAMASRACAVLAEWQIPLEHEAWNEHEDGQQFRIWLTVFRNACKEQSWITNPDLWRLVPRWIASGLCPDAAVVFAGFRNTTPALARLREALGSAAQSLQLERSVVPELIPVRRSNDLSEEIELAARWVRAGFEGRPGESVGVLVPDLANNRNLIERIFDRVFYPASAISSLGRAPVSDSIFHLHAAGPLRDQPLIAGALLLLKLANSRISIGEAGAILRSPWISGAVAERSERAIADIELRRSRELDVTLRDLEYRAKSCSNFLDVLRRLWRVLRDRPVEAEFATWSEFFNDILSAAGWPGDSELTAEEQSLVDLWKDRLSTLASLTAVSQTVTFDTALSRLELLLNEDGVARGDFFSPVQILDASRAIGLHFDGAFVASVSEESGFFSSSTSPLIPLKLQRACGVPGAAPSSMREHRELALVDLFSSAPNICASYSNRILPAAGRFLSEDGYSWALWDGRTPQHSFCAAELERLDDTHAPPYKPGPRSLGGTGLLKDQSQCPFRAFATRRLNARAPEDGSFGLDPLDRGRFAHDALKIVWDQLKTQDALRKIRPLELRFLVHEAVKLAVPAKEKGLLHQQLSLAELDRLAEVILEWLEVERQRNKPFAVELTEQERGLDIGNLHLMLRIDRIDKLKNGKYVLIDYKSGKTSASALNEDRPKEPQLLAYAAAMQNNVDGLFFGQLKPRDAQLVGYGRDIQVEGQKPPNKNLSWDEYLADRVAVVERLGKSFLAGDAAVDPVRGACQYCDLPSLCRIHEIRCAGKEENLDQ